jgi:hypothetical protein
MTGRQLKAYGKLLFGRRWQRGLAELLGKNRITIWRYAGMAKVPDEIADDITAALDTPLSQRNH